MLITQRMLLTSTAIVTIASVASTVQAQTPTPAGSANIGSAPAASGTSPADPDIVVTARRREERLKDVPISVTALSGKQLDAQGIKSTTDLFGKVPSLYFSQGNFAPTSDFTYLVIRGIGAAPALDPSVGVFIDGVYQPQVGFDVGFLDVERVEVLRGPQSTLFGRNTEAGALSITTRKPDDKFYGYVRGTADSFGGLGGSAMMSGPIANNLFMNFGATVGKTDGYVHNITRDDDQMKSHNFTLRSTLRWLPVENWEVLLTGDFTKINGDELGYGVPAGCHCYDVTDNRATTNRRQVGGGALTINGDLDFATFQSLTSYRFAKGNALWDDDGSASNVHVFNPNFPDWTQPSDSFDSRVTHQNDLSQEFRLTSARTSKLNWLVGAYLFKEHDNLDRLGSETSGAAAPGGPNTLFDGSVPGADGVFIRQQKTGYSFFGQLTYDLTEKLQVEGGLRYASETAKAQSKVNFLVPLSQDAQGINYFVFALDLNGRRKFDRALPSASIRYKFTPRLTGYVTYSEGEKSGGFQKFPANELDAKGFGAEYADNLEAGIKYYGPLFNFTGAIYNIWLKDQQVSATVLVDVGGGQTTPVGGVQNAASGRVRGAEAEVGLTPGAGWNLQGSASYNDTKYTNYVDSQGLQRNGSLYQHFPFVPSWLANITLSKTMQLSDDYQLGGQVSWRYTGHYYVGDGGVFAPFEQIPSYNVFDARLTLTAKKWSATLFVRNLFDRYAITQRVDPLADPTVLRDTPIPPRQVGGELTFRF